MIPALLMSTSTGPSSFSAASRKRANDSRSVTSSSKATALPPSSDAVCSARREIEVADRDPGAAADQRRRRALADPTGAARDRDDLPRNRLDLLARHLRLLLLVESVCGSSRNRVWLLSQSEQVAVEERDGEVSATSARSRSESTSRCSSGECAKPPSGPSPSIAIGTWGARLLASLAPPRGMPTIGRPSIAAARSSGSAAASAMSIPGQRRRRSTVRADAVDLVGDRGDHRLEGGLVVGPHVDVQLTGARDDVDSLARPHHRRDDAERLRPGRVVPLRERDRQRRRGRAARSARRPGSRRRGRPSRQRRSGWPPPPCAGRRPPPGRARSARRPRSRGRRRSRRSGGRARTARS